MGTAHGVNNRMFMLTSLQTRGRELYHSAVRHHLPIIVFLTLLGMLSRFASSNFLPLLTNMAYDFQVQAQHINLAVSVYTAGLCLSLAIYGACSDRWGRKPVIVTGLFICLLGSLLCLVAPYFWIFMTGHFIQGFGIGVFSALFRAILRDVYQGRDLAKADSYLNMALVPMAPLASIVGAYLGTYMGWRSNFLMVSLLVGYLLWMVMCRMPETLPVEKQVSRSLKTIIHLYIKIISHKYFLSQTLCAGLAYGAVMAYITATPFLYQTRFHISPLVFGWLSILIALGFLIGSIVNIKILKYYTIKKSLSLSAILLIMSTGLMVLLAWLGYANVWAVIFPMMGLTIANSFIYANAFASAFAVVEAYAGLAASLYAAIQMAVGAVISMIAAVLPCQNQKPLALLLFVIALLIAGIQWSSIARYD